MVGSNIKPISKLSPLQVCPTSVSVIFGTDSRNIFSQDGKIFWVGAHVMRLCMSPRSGVGEGQPDR